MTPVTGSFLITAALVALMVLTFIYPAFGVVCISVAFFFALWGLMHAIFGHHFEGTP